MRIFISEVHHQCIPQNIFLRIKLCEYPVKYPVCICSTGLLVPCPWCWHNLYQYAWDNWEQSISHTQPRELLLTLPELMLSPTSWSFFIWRNYLILHFTKLMPVSKTSFPASLLFLYSRESMGFPTAQFWYVPRYHVYEGRIETFFLWRFYLAAFFQVLLNTCPYTGFLFKNDLSKY